MAIEWNNNHLSCQAVWGCLRSLDQFGQNFQDAEHLTVKDLALWNKASDETMRSLLAKGLAGQLDAMVRNILGATYETDKSNEDAINELGLVFMNPDKTLPELAEVVDNIYVF